MQQKLDVCANERFKAALEARGESAAWPLRRRRLRLGSGALSSLQVRGADRPLTALQHRRQRLGRDHLLHLPPGQQTGRRGHLWRTSCSRVNRHGRVRGLQWSTAPPPCWSTPPALGQLAFTYDPSIGCFCLSHENIRDSGGGQDLTPSTRATTSMFPDGVRST